MREFIILPAFDTAWKKFGLDDDELRLLEEYLCLNPIAGAVIPGTEGLRKLRWHKSGKGKRGGMRVLYIDFVSHAHSYLITVYSKAEKDELTATEKKRINHLIRILRSEIQRSKHE